MARGRPRDATIDARVLETTVGLLASEGFSATTIQEVARRSGVNASAIYRRWPSRIELIEDASARGVGDVSVPVTGDLRRDLGRFVRAYERTFMAPAARAAIPALLSIYQHQSAPPSSQHWAHLSVRPTFYEILAAAGAVAVDPAVDPDDVFDLLLGVLLARALVPVVADRRRSVEVIVDLVVRALRPAPASSPA
jgi:AcrR family transcriptional regulator